MRKIDPIELGATLFTPATHKNIPFILERKKYPRLRSLLIDFEDGLDQSSYEDGVEKLQTSLDLHSRNDLFVFVRPKNPASLRQLLELDAIEKIDGFVLPKFSLKNSSEYSKLLKNRAFYVMPSIEGKELFDETSLKLLKKKILDFQQRLLLVRIGCEDIMRQIGLQRDCKRTLFDYAAPSFVIGRIIALFKSEGVNVSGCVYPCFETLKGFQNDITRDIQEGMFSKTIIHPSHIELADEAYKVTKEEVQKAQEILSTAKAILNQNGMMGEKTTRTPYARFILKRSKYYGIV